jgi:hypothetical protein
MYTESTAVTVDAFRLCAVDYAGVLAATKITGK